MVIYYCVDCGEKLSENDTICPICGSKTFEKVTQNNGILGPGGRSWAIYYICSSCSVLFKDVEKFFKKQNDKQLKQLGGKRGIKDVHL